MVSNVEVLVVKVRSGFFLNYCYIVRDHISKKQVIIDPAWELDKISNLLDGCPYKVEAVLITHSHIDHMNLAKAISTRYNATIYMSEIEISYSHFLSLGLVGFQDGEELRFGNIKFLCLLTPGHTKGSTCYLGNDSFFSGDTLFMEGCGICETREDALQLFDSFQKIKETVSQEHRLYPGHSYGRLPGGTMQEVYRSNIYYQFETAEMFADFRMRKKQNGFFDFK